MMELGFCSSWGVGRSTIASASGYGQSCSAFTGRSTASALGSWTLAPVTVVEENNGAVAFRRGRVQMNLFQRFFRVLRANANEAVSSVEDPTKIIKQALEEMERDLQKVTSSYSETKASLKRAEKEREKIQEDIASWTKRAELALEKKDEDLAREALSVRKEREVALSKAEDQVKEMTVAADNFYNAMIKYKEKIEEAKGQADQYTARAAAANALKTANEMETGVGEGAAATFGKMKEKVEAMEISAEVGAEALPGAGNPELDAKFRALESDDVEDELQQMKNKMLGGGEKKKLPEGGDKNKLPETS